MLGHEGQATLCLGDATRLGGIYRQTLEVEAFPQGDASVLGCSRLDFPTKVAPAFGKKNCIPLQFQVKTFSP